MHCSVMTLNLALRLLRPLQRANVLVRRCESTVQNKDDIELSDVSTVAELGDPMEDERIAQIRNKSRLTPFHRNALNGINPYPEAKAWYHNTRRYKKRVLGRYGLNYLDVTPGVVWPTTWEVKDKQEYERVAYPLSIQEEWEIIRKKKEEQAEQIRKREAELAANVAKNEKWINELHAKIKQKEDKLIEAKKLRERVILEVKRELNMQTISLADEKVMALVLKKEKDHRKKLKAEKSEKKSKKAASPQPSEASEE